jgi:hypothetical protein
VILVVGVNGSGKTTSIAKLAHRFQKPRGKRVLLGACDTFRAAAAEQLEIWAQAQRTRRSCAARRRRPRVRRVRRGRRAARALGVDVVLLDTAGRLHTQEPDGRARQGERVIAKRLPGAPHEVWLVLDGTNGQNAIQQAREFTASGQGHRPRRREARRHRARRRACSRSAGELGLPVRYIGTGEQLELLEPFDPEAFVDAIVVALAALPAIGFVALTRRSAVAFGLTPLFVYALVGFASLRLRPPSDTLEADRALLLLLGALALALVGASTRRGARERFVIGVHGLALLLLGAALFDREHRFAGVLQNTGATSEAALAGALVGAWSFATARGGRANARVRRARRVRVLRRARAGLRRPGVARGGARARRPARAR